MKKSIKEKILLTFAGFLIAESMQIQTVLADTDATSYVNDSSASDTDSYLSKDSRALKWEKCLNPTTKVSVSGNTVTIASTFEKELFFDSHKNIYYTLVEPILLFNNDRITAQYYERRSGIQNEVLASQIYEGVTYNGQPQNSYGYRDDRRLGASMRGPAYESGKVGRLLTANTNHTELNYSGSTVYPTDLTTLNPTVKIWDGSYKNGKVDAGSKKEIRVADKIETSYAGKNSGELTITIKLTNPTPYLTGISYWTADHGHDEDGEDYMSLATAGYGTYNLESYVGKAGHKHTGLSVTKAAGCTTQGLKSGTCPYCGYAEEKIDETGHKVPSSYTADNNKGIHYKNCSICGTNIETKKNPYKITFHGNGSTGGSMNDQSMVYDTASTLSKNAFSKESPVYSFDGWNTKADGSGTKYKDGEQVRNLTAVYDGKVDLYAVWKRNTARMSFLDYDGTLLGSKEFNLGISITDDSFPHNEREGYTFSGWEGVDGASTDYVTKEGSYKAAYTANRYKVIFDYQGGDGDIKEKICTFGENIGEMPSPERDEMIFAGWYTETDGNGDAVSTESKMGAEDLTVYAFWKKPAMKLNDNVIIEEDVPEKGNGGTEGTDAAGHDGSDEGHDGNLSGEGGGNTSEGQENIEQGGSNGQACAGSAQGGSIAVNGGKPEQDSASSNAGRPEGSSNSKDDEKTDDGETEDDDEPYEDQGSHGVTGDWILSEDGRWSFRDDSGFYYRSGWGFIYNPYAGRGQNSGDWFRFDENGYMITGWYRDPLMQDYYLNPVSDGMLGCMLTGWQWIKGNDSDKAFCYYFNPVSDGSMGRLMKDTVTPDGYTLNELGQWTENGVAQTR